MRDLSIGRLHKHFGVKTGAFVHSDELGAGAAAPGSGGNHYGPRAFALGLSWTVKGDDLGGLGQGGSGFEPVPLMADASAGLNHFTVATRPRSTALAQPPEGGWLSAHQRGLRSRRALNTVRLRFSSRTVPPSTNWPLSSTSAYRLVTVMLSDWMPRR